MDDSDHPHHPWVMSRTFGQTVITSERVGDLEPNLTEEQCLISQKVNSHYYYNILLIYCLIVFRKMTFTINLIFTSLAGYAGKQQKKLLFGGV